MPQFEEEAVIKAQIKKRIEQSPGLLTDTRSGIKGILEEKATRVHDQFVSAPSSDGSLSKEPPI